MRHFGWMELGFCEDFFIDTFHLRGWLISDHQFAGVGRASAYVAKRALGTTVKLLPAFFARLGRGGRKASLDEPPYGAIS
jgi:hypothetical protein